MDDQPRGAIRRRTLAEIAAGPPTVTVATACADLGISVSHGYALIKQDAFPARVLLVGARRLVVTASLIAILGGNEAAA